jgi:dTDP-4-dehydrorhamnose 3,5-epimerase
LKIESEIVGVKTWTARVHTDERGSFFKAICEDTFTTIGFEPIIKEVFTSTTIKGGVRGMHLQTEEFANYRLIFASHGIAHDVLLDLRKESPTYGNHSSIELSAKSGTCIFVPPGVAHGFQALEPSVIQYLTTTHYSEAHDTGVNPLSFGYDWPIEITSVSRRDLNLPKFEEWDSRE